MSEIRRKGPDVLREQVARASLIHDDPKYFQATDAQFALTDQSQLQGLPRWQEYTRALRTVNRGRIFSEQIGSFLEYERTHPSPMQLLDAQRDAIESIQEAFEEGKMHTSIVMPTGAGKTAIFAKTAQALGLRTLIISPSQIGVEQVRDTFDELGMADRLGTVYAQDKTFDRQVTVTTLDSLTRYFEQGTLQDGSARDKFYSQDYDLVILDDAHLLLTQTRREVARSFQNCARLAFTATPVFNEEREVEGAFGEIIHRMSIQDAVESGLIAERISSSVVRTNVDISDVHLTPLGDYSPGELFERINTDERNNAAVDVYMEHFLGEQVIIKCANIRHAAAMEHLFRQRLEAENERRRGLGQKEIKVRHVASDMTQNQIRYELNQAKAGETTIVCAARLLDVAFDAPSISLAINLVPTLNRVAVEQFGGRIIRKDRATGKQKHARIVDFLDIDTTQGRAPIIYGQVLGAPSVTASFYQEPAAQQAISGGTPHPSRAWRYVDNPDQIRRIIADLDIQDANVDLTQYAWFTDIMAAFPDERRETLIRSLADMLRAREFRGGRILPSKIPSTLYPLNIIDRLRHSLETEYQVAPEGWTTEKTFAPLVHRKWQSFGAFIDADLAAHPERRRWVGVYANKRGRARYLSSEYQQALSIELHRETLPKPEGYSVTGTRELMERTGFAGMETMLSAAGRLITLHNRPDWIIRNFWDGDRHRIVNLYADELVALLKQEADLRNATPEADQSWRSKQDMRKRVTAADQPALVTWLDNYAELHPEDTGIGKRRRRGTESVYYDPAHEDRLVALFLASIREVDWPADHIRVAQLVDEICATVPSASKGGVFQSLKRWLASQDITLQEHRYDPTRKPAQAMPNALAARFKLERYGIVSATGDTAQAPSPVGAPEETVESVEAQALPVQPDAAEAQQAEDEVIDYLKGIMTGSPDSLSGLVDDLAEFLSETPISARRIPASSPTYLIEYATNSGQILQIKWVQWVRRGGGI